MNRQQRAFERIIVPGLFQGRPLTADKTAAEAWRTVHPWNTTHYRGDARDVQSELPME